MNELIKELEPYFSLISAVLSLATLGFILQLVGLISSTFSVRIEAMKEQKEVVEDRLKKAQEDMERQEKWYQKEIIDLKRKLDDVMDIESTGTEQLVFGVSSAKLSDELQEKIDSILQAMSDLESQISHGGKERILDPSWFLKKANGFTLSGDWIAAANNYEKYTQFFHNDWEVHYLRAVAYANCRGGVDTNLAALQAMNDAIAYSPKDLDRNFLARMYDYRGAYLKRLERLEEAESSLSFAKKLAHQEYEIFDIAYNLACVYAMMKNKENMLENLRLLGNSKYWRERVKAQPNYFMNYLEDRDFKSIVY